MKKQNKLWIKTEKLALVMTEFTIKQIYLHQNLFEYGSRQIV